MQLFPLLSGAAADEQKLYCACKLPVVYLPPLHFLYCFDSVRCPEAALCCILEPVLGRAAEFSAPGTHIFEEQGKFTEPYRHIRARLARQLSRSAGTQCDFLLSSVSLGVATGEGLQAMAG